MSEVRNDLAYLEEVIARRNETITRLQGELEAAEKHLEIQAESLNEACQKVEELHGVWTTKTPTEEGFYWFYHGHTAEARTIARVFTYDGGELYIHRFGWDYPRPMRTLNADSEWSDPLPEPPTGGGESSDKNLPNACCYKYDCKCAAGGESENPAQDEQGYKDPTE